MPSRPVRSRLSGARRSSPVLTSKGCWGGSCWAIRAHPPTWPLLRRFSLRTTPASSTAPFCSSTAAFSPVDTGRRAQRPPARRVTNRGGDAVAKIPYLYEHLTWEEVNDAVRAGKCALIPVATIEDHGPHLPVDADVEIVSAICERAAQRAPDELVLLPCVRIGFSPHHVDFPGTLTIRWTTFVEYVLDITRSLAHHGFRKMLIVNGHGSNRPLMEMAARLTIVERPDVHCAFTSWR